MEKIGVWLMEIGREIPCEKQHETCNKDTNAGCELSSKLNCQRFKRGEQQERRAKIPAEAERLGRKAFTQKGKEKKFKEGTSWPQKPTYMLISCCQQIRISCLRQFI